MKQGNKKRKLRKIKWDLEKIKMDFIYFFDTRYFSLWALRPVQRVKFNVVLPRRERVVLFQPT